MLEQKEKVTLAEELIDIIENRHCPLINRVQAATILANSHQELGLNGSSKIAQRLVSVLKNEFIPVLISGGGEHERQRSVFLCGLDGLEVLLFRHVAHAIFRIDLKEAEFFFDELGPLVEGSEIADCIGNLKKRKK